MGEAPKLLFSVSRTFLKNLSEKLFVVFTISLSARLIGISTRGIGVFDESSLQAASDIAITIPKMNEIYFMGCYFIVTQRVTVYGVPTSPGVFSGS